MSINLQSLKDRPGLLLIAGAMVVGAPRWMDSFGFEAQVTVALPGWGAVHYWSGLGMVLIEALSIWYTASMLSRYGKRNLIGYGLFALIVCMFVSIPAILIPSIAATSNGLTLKEMWGREGVIAWSFPMALAPMFIVAASAIAEHLSIPSNRMVAPEPEITEDGGQHLAQHSDSFARIAQPNAQLTAQPAQRLTLEQAIEASPEGGPTSWAEAMGGYITRQAVASRRDSLVAQGKLRKNGRGWEVVQP